MLLFIKECKNERSELFAEVRSVTGGSGEAAGMNPASAKNRFAYQFYKMVALRTGSERGRDQLGRDLIITAVTH
ncbi:MAG: hypothetical protein B6245_07835 [Desulfobacteraceae bacterium 4572_88]|nr:MAG: hypothetical protein B6245_07835 [Desulfobacteraceae bacterium 4572_88]